uniref:Lipoprotein n=1 Tax=Shewanella sp. (strain MR-7) TaxID=60481 RepID=Q0HXX5_SHESR
MKKTIFILTAASLFSLAGCATKPEIYSTSLTIFKIPASGDTIDVTYKIEHGKDCLITMVLGPQSNEQKYMAALDGESRRCLEDVTGESQVGLDLDLSGARDNNPVVINYQTGVGPLEELVALKPDDAK